MKRDELKALGLTDEQVDKVMGIHGTDEAAHKAVLQARDEQITTLTTERDGLKTQVADRDKDITQLRKDAGDNETLKNQLAELQTKYETDTTKLQQTLDQQAREFAVESIFSGVQFTSAFAKKAAIAEFKAGNHEFKDGKFVGADGIIAQMKKDNPDAFKAEDDGKGGEGGKPKGEGGEGGKKPQFTNSLDKGGNGGGGNDNPFNFNFTAVRKTNGK